MEWYGYVLLVAGLLIVAFIFFLIGMLYRKKVAEREIGSAETEATRIINEAIKGGENKKREMLVEAKEEIHKSRTEYEKEVKERRADLLARLARCHEDDEAVEYLRSTVENEGGLTFAAEVMQGYIARAVEMLSDYPDSEYRSALVNLCAYIAERDR